MDPRDCLGEAFCLLMRGLLLAGVGARARPLTCHIQVEHTGMWGAGGSFFWSDQGVSVPQDQGKIRRTFKTSGDSLVAQTVKNLPAMQETGVQSLSPEDLLEKGMATQIQYSCLEHPMDRGAWWATVHGVAESWTRLSD